MKSPLLRVNAMQNSLLASVGISAALALAIGIGAGAVAAQTSGGQSGSRQYSRNNRQSSSSGTTPLSTVLAQMSRAAGVQILADRAVSDDTVTAPTVETTAANVDGQIKELVAQLPSGSVSGKFYLPASASRNITADSLEAFALAESRLFGPVGGPQTTGTIEILGQKLSSEKATTVVSALNLQPIYLIGNPNAAQQSLMQNNSGATASQQAQQILGMDATQRQQALQQMMSQNQQVMSQVMQNVSPEERQQLMQSLRSTMAQSGGGFGGARGRGPGGPGGPSGGPEGSQ